MILNLIINLNVPVCIKMTCCYHKLLGMPKSRVALQTTDFFLYFWCRKYCLFKAYCFLCVCDCVLWCFPTPSMEFHGHALSAGWSDASWESVWVCVCSRMRLKEIWSCWNFRKFLSSTLTLQSDGISLTPQWPDGFPYFSSVYSLFIYFLIETRAGRLIE